MRQGPTAPALLSTDFGEMKMPEPMMVPTMIQMPLSRPTWAGRRKGLSGRGVPARTPSHRCHHCATASSKQQAAPGALRVFSHWILARPPRPPPPVRWTQEETEAQAGCSCPGLDPKGASLAQLHAPPMSDRDLPGTDTLGVGDSPGFPVADWAFFKLELRASTLSHPTSPFFFFL
jgi:hypothetical protein